MTDSRILNEFHLFCQALPQKAAIKKNALSYHIIYEERTYLSWRGVGRAERKGPRLNKREYFGVNVVYSKRRSHVTPIDIPFESNLFYESEILFLLYTKHTVLSYDMKEIEFRNIYSHHFFVADFTRDQH